jgi:hypothetical protein
MTEVEGKVANQHISILIDLGASHNYIALNLVEQFNLKKSKHEKSWLIQVAIGPKRKISEIAKGFSLDMNGVIIIVDLNIILVVSYNVLIQMDWLNVHYVILDCHNKTFTCLDEEGK